MFARDHSRGLGWAVLDCARLGDTNVHTKLPTGKVSSVPMAHGVPPSSSVRILSGNISVKYFQSSELAVLRGSLMS